MGTRDTGKRCDEIRPLLSDAALGQLEGAALEALEAHLATCRQCARRADEIAEALELLDAAPSVAPSAGFDESLALRLRTERTAEVRQQVGVFALLAVLLRRARRFELGAAVYPLVLMAMSYVLWAVITRDGGYPVAVRDDGGGGGRLMLWEGRPRPDSRSQELLMEKLAEGEGTVGEDAFARSELPAEPSDLLPRHVVEPQPVEPPAREHPEPRTPQELEKWPEPPRQPAPAPMLRVGGSALAQSRFADIRTSGAHVHRAISGALVWLERNQEKDGSWRAVDARTGAKPAPTPGDYSDVEVTAAGALAFMESGFTPHGTGDASRSLRRALTWLLRQQGADGLFAPAGKRQIEAQAMVCLALSEALRLADSETSVRRFRPAVEQALGALVKRQGSGGGWGTDAPDLTIMALMATSAARAAGLAVDPAAQDSALAWLDAYRAQNRSPGIVQASREPTAAVAKGLSFAPLGRVLATVEAQADSEAAAEALAGLREAPVVWQSGECFRWYAATLAAYRLNGRFWQEWRSDLVCQIVGRQEGLLRAARLPAQRGSWEPVGASKGAGRAYATAAAVLSLAASCGHSPLYGGAR